MALFKLTDITFNRDQAGPLTKLQNAEGIGTDTNILKYPMDLGEYDKGHYMIIYINEQVTTKYSDGGSASATPTIMNSQQAIESIVGPVSAGSQFTNILNGITKASADALNSSLAKEAGDKVVSIAEKVGVPSSFIDKIGGAITGATKELPLGTQNLLKDTLNYMSQNASQLNSVLNSGTFLRKIRRTKQAIALYMPDTLTFAYNQTYNGISVYDTLGKVGTALAAGSSIVDAIKNGGSQRDAINVASFGLQFLKDFAGGDSGNIANLGLAQLGVASNPGLELIYGSPSFRQFRFDFLFYPRSKQEGKMVQDIINSLKFHQAPEFASQTGGRFLVPPSEFDIEFYHNGKVNPNIPKISTCVLTGIDVDYAPNGWSSYEVPGQSASMGGTGMPVATRLSLSFTETQIVTKEYLRWASGDFDVKSVVDYNLGPGW